MNCKLLVACLALVPHVILAEKCYLFGCGNFRSMLDPNAGTQEDINTLTKFFSKYVEMYLWDPSYIESNQSCNAIKIPLTAGMGTFTYKIDNAGTTYTGTAKYTVSPRVRLELNGTLPESILGANSMGYANWYPLYISSTDVAFLACRNVLLGRRESIYVMTNQVYKGLDSNCAADAVSTAIKKSVKALSSLAGGATSCTIPTK